jgi:DNA-binding XRE family transcriptional regulator
MRRKMVAEGKLAAYHEWTEAEEATLRGLYPRSDRAEILAAIPKHNWIAIRTRASILGVYRVVVKDRPGEIDPLVRKLTALRKELRKSVRWLAAQIDVKRDTIMAWELGDNEPRLFLLRRWCAALGLPTIDALPARRDVTPFASITPPTPAQLMGRKAA